MVFPLGEAGLAKTIKIFQLSLTTWSESFLSRRHWNTLLLNPRLKVISLHFMWCWLQEAKTDAAFPSVGDVHASPEPYSVPSPKNLWLEPSDKVRMKVFSQRQFLAGTDTEEAQKYYYYPVDVESTGNISRFLQQLIWPFGNRKIHCQ